MPPPPPPTLPLATPDGGSSAQVLLRRRMFRLTLMVASILTVVAGLVIAAVLMGMDARRQQQRAESAERQSKEQLWQSHRDRAEVKRRSGQAGRRLEGMAALEKAAAGWRALHGAEGGDSAERMSLREEAAALLALPDMAVSRALLPVPPDTLQLAADAAQDLLATADSAGNITVRRLSDGVELAQMDREPGVAQGSTLMGLEWRPRPAGPGGGGVLLGAWYMNGEVAMWSLPAAKKCYSWMPPGGRLNGGRGSPGRFSADGNYMAFYTRDDSALTILDLRLNTVLTHSLPAGRAIFAIRPGHSQIAIAAGETITLTDFVNGGKHRTWPVSRPIFSLAWSADGSRLAAMDYNGDVFLWSMDTKNAWTLNGHTTQPRALAFSPDGRTLMSSSRDGTTRWWDAERGSPLLMSREGKGLSWNADGTAVAFESNAGGVGEWRVSPSPVLQVVSPPGRPDTSVEYFDLSPDGRWLIASIASGLTVWDTSGITRPGHLLQMSLRMFAFEPSGTLLVLTNDGLSRKRIVAGDQSPPQVGNAGSVPLALPDGGKIRLMAPSADGRSLLVELTDRRCGIADLLGERAYVPLELSPGKVFYRGPGSTTGGGRLAVSPDGKYASYGYGIAVGTTVFDTSSGRKVWHYDRGDSMVQFSSDSRHLLLAGNGAAELRRCGDWSSAKMRVLPGQLASSAALAFGAEHRLVALASAPQTMQICRDGDLSPLVTLAAAVPRNLNGCRLARDGSLLAVACSANQLQLWNLRTLRQELSRLGLDWQDAATAPATVLAAADKGGGAWGFALWLCAAAIAAAIAAVVMLRRHHGLMRDFASAEAQLTVQREDLAKANFSLLHSQKMKALGTLAAGMAHDFNNLLSVIRMSNKLIARETRGHGEVTELVDSVETAVLQGKQVVSSMLSYSREETGPARPVAAVVRDASALLSTEFLSGIAMSLDLDDTTPAVDIPAGRIEQILLNLIVNASEAMSASGTLTIAVRRATAQMAGHCLLQPHTAAEYVEIAVADTGPGIAPDIADRIFEPFFTTKNAGNDRGTGLGLSMVYTIAERDGMGLALRSVPGHGATFSVFLPVRETHTDSAPVPV